MIEDDEHMQVDLGTGKLRRQDRDRLVVSTDAEPQKATTFTKNWEVNWHINYTEPEYKTNNYEIEWPNDGFPSNEAFVKAIVNQFRWLEEKRHLIVIGTVTQVR